MSHESLNQPSDISQRSHTSKRSYDARSHHSDVAVKNLAPLDIGCYHGNHGHGDIAEHHPTENELELGPIVPSEQGNMTTDEHDEQCFTPLAPGRASTPLNSGDDSGRILGREVGSEMQCVVGRKGN